MLKDAGYFVFWAGKNDLVPGQHSFDPYCDIKYTPPTAHERPYRYFGPKDEWHRRRGEPFSKRHQHVAQRFVSRDGSRCLAVAEGPRYHRLQAYRAKAGHRAGLLQLGLLHGYRNNLEHCNDGNRGVRAVAVWNVIITGPSSSPPFRTAFPNRHISTEPTISRFSFGSSFRFRKPLSP
jgi:hypothetical protein